MAFTSLFQQSDKSANDIISKVVDKVISNYQSQLKDRNTPDEKEFKTMIMLMAVFNPQFGSEDVPYPKSMSPDEIKALVKAQELLIGLLERPENKIRVDQFVNAVDKQAASEIVQREIYSHLNMRKDHIDDWNRHFKSENEDNPMHMSDKGAKYFKECTGEMQQIVNRRADLAVKQSRSIGHARQAVNVGTGAIAFGAAFLIGSLVASGPTFGASVAVAAAVTGAVLAGATVAYCFYKHKSKKQGKELASLREVASEKQGKFDRETPDLMSKELLNNVLKAPGAKSLVDKREKHMPLKNDVKYGSVDIDEVVETVLVGGGMGGRGGFTYG